MYLYELKKTAPLLFVFIASFVLAFYLRGKYERYLSGVDVIKKAKTTGHFVSARPIKERRVVEFIYRGSLEITETTYEYEVDGEYHTTKLFFLDGDPNYFPNKDITVYYGDSPKKVYAEIGYARDIYRSLGLAFLLIFPWLPVFIAGFFLGML